MFGWEYCGWLNLRIAPRKEWGVTVYKPRMGLIWDIARNEQGAVYLKSRGLALWWVGVCWESFPQTNCELAEHIS